MKLVKQWSTYIPAITTFHWGSLKCIKPAAKLWRPWQVKYLHYSSYLMERKQCL